MPDQDYRSGQLAAAHGGLDERGDRVERRRLRDGRGDRCGGESKTDRDPGSVHGSQYILTILEI